MISPKIVLISASLALAFLLAMIGIANKAKAHDPSRAADLWSIR